MIYCWKGFKFKNYVILYTILYTCNFLRYTKQEKKIKLKKNEKNNNNIFYVPSMYFIMYMINIYLICTICLIIYLYIKLLEKQMTQN